jgi:hypothetical protein
MGLSCGVALVVQARQLREIGSYPDDPIAMLHLWVVFVGAPLFPGISSTFLETCLVLNRPAVKPQN